MDQEEDSSKDTTTIHMAEQFFINLKLNDDDEKANEVLRFEKKFREEKESDEEHSDEDEEFSFSLAFDGLINESQITAEEAFSNGSIKRVFPLFNQDLLLEEKLISEELIVNGKLPNVKKVFVPATDSTSGNDDNISGPYCDWDSKSVETKKSNSTGFSKIWRFKDFMHRSSSDGKDAFVFLNNTSSPSGTTVNRKREETIVNKGEKQKELSGNKVNGDKGKVTVVGDSKTEVKKGKKVVKSKTAPSPSPHEVYLKSKARAEQQRRSYRTYRPEVVGLFTNIAGGGLTRNVHPF